MDNTTPNADIDYGLSVWSGTIRKVGANQPTGTIADTTIGGAGQII
jgi:hypothetical protein